VVERSWSDQPPEDELTPYLSEPPPSTHRDLHQWREDLARARQRSTGLARYTDAPVLPFDGHPAGVSPVFARMVPLRRSLLAVALADWWGARARAGYVTVQRRLRLEAPEGDVAAGWLIRGRVRRLTGRHWVPVVVELWPKYDDLTMMTMTPQSHVFATKRYFRIGHAVLERFWADLAEIIEAETVAQEMAQTTAGPTRHQSH
jgi:hypothetical protein